MILVKKKNDIRKNIKKLLTNILTFLYSYFTIKTADFTNGGKNMKKLISVILTLTMLLSVCIIPASAENYTSADGKTYEIDGSYPYVFVHGMGGWGPHYEEMPYWGGWADSEGDIIKMFNENGIEAYAATVGPFNSAWDRACELYAQLTGTVVDYGKAHSEKHNHDRYGVDFTGKALMGEAWDCESAINLVGHSFGGPAVRLFASLIAYGDETEAAATGDDTSPLFLGGHEKSINAVITLSGVHNGSPIANLIHDNTAIMTVIAFFGNIIGVIFGRSILMYDDVQLGHFGITARQDQERATFSWERIRNFATTGDNCGSDMTLSGAKALNEKIKLSPYTYYYSYSTIATEETAVGTQVPISSNFVLFYGTSLYIGALEGQTIDGIYMDKNWAINDGIVPLASALYPSDCADTAKCYDDAIAAGEKIEPGRWYYMTPSTGFDHFDYCGTIDYPTSFEDFYFTMVETVCKNQ